MAITDMAGPVDNIGFGHTIHPEIDRRGAVPVDTDMREGVAETVEETARIFGFVFVRDAVQGHPRPAYERHQRSMLFAARSAPRGEEIDQRRPAVEIFAGQPVRSLVKARQ